jgi:TonB family protein
MTAAALRPDLFTHLFATQREHPQKSDFAATALSLLLHGAAVAALIWASTSLERTEAPVIEKVWPIVIATPYEVERVTSSGGGRPAAGQPALAVPDRFDAPIIDAPNPTPFDSADDFVQPGPPTPAPKPQPGGGGGEPTFRNGFEIRNTLPALLNPQEVKRALERNYPAILRDAGIGGRVSLWLLINENGRVVSTEIKEGSGHQAFDDAAKNVGEIMRFSPAMNRDERVKVWVRLPIVFKTQ